MLNRKGSLLMSAVGTRGRYVSTWTMTLLPLAQTKFKMLSSSLSKILIYISLHLSSSSFPFTQASYPPWSQHHLSKHSYLDVPVPMVDVPVFFVTLGFHFPFLWKQSLFPFGNLFISYFQSLEFWGRWFYPRLIVTYDLGHPNRPLHFLVITGHVILRVNEVPWDFCWGD